MSPLLQHDLFELQPYAILVAGSLLVLLFSLFRDGPKAFMYLSSIAIGSTIAAGISLWTIGEVRFPFDGLLVHDQVGFGFGAVILFFLLLSLFIRPSEDEPLGEKPSIVFSLLLLSACGGLLLVHANHLLIAFVALEILSIPLYILSGFAASRDSSAEGAFKYFLLGSIASAFFIYGVALIWGATGSMVLSELPKHLMIAETQTPGLVLIGAALVMAGIAFKLGLVPFHMWLPDVYQGAPSAIVSWMAGAVKASILALGIRFAHSVLYFSEFEWQEVVVWLAMISMIWGSFAALAQKNSKRMLAYSSIAHAGYMMIALIVITPNSAINVTTALIFYVLVYGLGSLLAFAVLSLEEKQGKTNIEDLRGLAKRRGGAAFALGISLLSLAGIPPLAGFFGKFYVFKLAIDASRLELALVGVLTSVVSLGYYLNLIVKMYMVDPETTQELRFPLGVRAAIGVAALAMVLLGIFPGPVIQFFVSNAQGFY